MSDSYQQKFSTVKDSVRPAHKYDYVCQANRLSQEDIKNPACIVGKNSERSPKILLWGDSNAAHYIGMLGVFARNHGFQFRNVQIGACPPLVSDPTDFVATKRLNDCRYSLELVWPLLQEYEVVILSASYPGYQARSQLFLSRFFSTIETLTNQGKLVIIIGKAPVIASYKRLCREKAISFPLISCEVADVPLGRQVKNINEALMLFAKKSDNVEYYDANKYLCPNDICSAFNKEGELIYFDSHHLALFASWQLGNKIIEVEKNVPFPFSLISSWKTKPK